MISINDAVLQLTDAIQASGEHRNYIRERERVKHYPELKAQLDEFRRRNFEMQTQTSGDIAFEEIEQMEKEYADFRDNPIVEDFLTAELAFCRMMQDINRNITEAIDFE